jgi:hypothetical protein
MTARLICGVVVLLAAGCATMNSSVGVDPTLAQQLQKLEEQSWVAWKARDGQFFATFLSDDHVEVGFRGPTDKATVVAGVASPACVVESYALGKFQATRLAADTAVLVYHAEQKTTCGGVAVPSPVWATSLYVFREGRWQNALYQQTRTSQ